MRTLILFVLVSLLTSCASYTPPPKTKNIMYYQHPIHGEVTKESEAYIAASDICEAKVYTKGIQVDGSMITDREHLEQISRDHRKAYTSARLRNDINFSGAHAGTQGAMAVATGNTSTASSSSQRGNIDLVSYILDYNKLDHPDHIDQIHMLKKQHLECIKVDQKFTATRIEQIVEETGELIRSTNLSEIKPEKQ